MNGQVARMGREAADRPGQSTATMLAGHKGRRRENRRLLHPRYRNLTSLRKGYLMSVLVQLIFLPWLM